MQIHIFNKNKIRPMIREQNVAERRQQTNKLISELLEERKDVWHIYSEIAEMKPFAEEQPIEIIVQRFCQILIDYISLGHFGVYQRLMDGSERRRKVLAVAEEIYPQIAQTTDAAVAFNDSYEKLDGPSLRRNLIGDLSMLGEALATRFELEDRLIDTMTA
jgi:regulator of sigma D